MDALINAVVNGKAKKVRALIASGADVNGRGDDGWTPLHNAAYKRNCEICKILIAASADINCPARDGCAPLHIAIESWGWEETWSRIRGHRAPNIEVFEILIAAGADINALDGYGRTPATMALGDFDPLANFFWPLVERQDLNHMIECDSSAPRRSRAAL